MDKLLTLNFFVGFMILRSPLNLTDFVLRKNITTTSGEMATLTTDVYNAPCIVYDVIGYEVNIYGKGALVHRADGPAFEKIHLETNRISEVEWVLCGKKYPTVEEYIRENNELSDDEKINLYLKYVGV